MLHIGQPAFGANEAIIDVDKFQVCCITVSYAHHVTVMAASPSTTPTIALFDQFRKEIDDHNDTRECLIKVFDHCPSLQRFNFKAKRLAVISPTSPRRLSFFSIAWRWKTRPALMTLPLLSALLNMDTKNCGKYKPSSPPSVLSFKVIDSGGMSDRSLQDYRSTSRLLALHAFLIVVP